MYRDDLAFSRFEYHFHSFSIFSLYHRVFLYALSQSTRVNLDFILCANSSDPFFKYVGKWYYLFADLYIGVGSYILRVLLMSIAYSAKKLYLKAVGSDTGNNEIKHRKTHERQVEDKKKKAE